MSRINTGNTAERHAAVRAAADCYFVPVLKPQRAESTQPHWYEAWVKPTQPASIMVKSTQVYSYQGQKRKEKKKKKKTHISIRITVESTQPYSLQLNKQIVNVVKGKQTEKTNSFITILRAGWTQLGKNKTKITGVLPTQAVTSVLKVKIE